MIRVRNIKSLFSQIKPSKSQLSQKYEVDYQYFAQMSIKQRLQQLRRIMDEKRSDDIQYNTQFPQYPTKQIWHNKGIDHQAYYFQPKGAPKALLITYHGLNGHTALSGKLAKNLSELGIVVAGYDFKNFGASSGDKRGLITDIQEQIIEPSQQFMKYAMKKYSFKNVFVSGLSLGGSVAFQMAIRNQSKVKGVILLSPAMKDNPYHFPITKKLLFFAGIFLPPFQIPLPKNEIPKKLKQIQKEDQLLYRGKYWFTTSYQCLLLLRETYNKWGQFKSPYLLIQSGTDKVLNPFQCIDFQKKCASEDKTTVIIKDMWHAVYYQPVLNDVIKICKQWMKNRV